MVSHCRKLLTAWELTQNRSYNSMTRQRDIQSQFNLSQQLKMTCQVFTDLRFSIVGQLSLHLCAFVASNIIPELNLPPSQLPYYFYNYPTVFEKFCHEDPGHHLCQIRPLKSCWGYEIGCHINNSYKRSECYDFDNSWAHSKTEQLETFYKQADFGFITQQRNELKVICEAQYKNDSSLECSDHLRFCRGRNIRIDFGNLISYPQPIRYKLDVLRDGDISGYCRLYKSRIKSESDYMLGALQSWAPEIRYFTSLKTPAIPEKNEIIVEEPTFIMKLDATLNMYHHFCDFFNLYASLHVNSSHESTFSTNVRILIWESYTYQSPFSKVFQAFTHYPIWDLKHVRDKVINFKNVVFPLLPRMIFGLYYNTPLINGCHKSGLFDAFSRFLLHRLNIQSHIRTDNRIRITFLSRNTTYRRVLNEQNLLKALINNKANYKVDLVVFNSNIPFEKQLEITYNTDIFIGIHGAGLTHLLFLPEWAVIFELYNCEDASCYRELARLKGVKYITWKDKNKLITEEQDKENENKGHAKFANYKFDVDEFMKLITEAADYVRNQKLFPGNKFKHHDEFR